MQQILVFCDGGLANRVRSLVSGICLADILGLDYLILWPRNNRCDAAFEDLFRPGSLAMPVLLQDLVPYQEHLRLWLHENDYGFTEPVVRLRDLSGVDQLKALHARDGKSILFCENSFLPWLPDPSIDAALARLSFRSEIVARTARVLKEKSPGPFYGVHLRATDFTVPPPVDQMLSVIKANPEHRFFVCSDDPDLERQFSLLSNVFVHEKEAYVEKFAAGGWRGAFVDSDGLPYTSNINRTRQSVVEACVDLLLLAASTPIVTSHSSFLALSQRLRTSGFLARHFSG